MKERIKSLVLVLLVAGSLLQTYYLIYRLPGSDSVTKSAATYIKTDHMGPEESVDNLIYPDRMVIHLGEDKHTLFYPKSMFYNLIYSRLQGRTFESFQRRTMDEDSLAQLRAEHTGIELTFDSGVPVVLLQRVMQIEADPLFEVEQIDRIWIYTTKNENKAHVLFFSTQGNVVYEAGKADLTVQDVQQHVEFGRRWVPYTSVNGNYYIPEKDIDIVQAELNIGVYTAEQMQRSLFFDPSITRNIREKNGSEIYTDSKRSLQVRQEQKWMSYTDPASPPTGESSSDKDVLSAIDYVNQHGGWQGTYRLHLSGSGEEQSKVQFQEYYGSYPILDRPHFHYGVIRLELQQGTVYAYERSLIYLEEQERAKEMRQLPGGEELKKKLSEISTGSEIVDLYPAYLPNLTDEGLLLKPVWAVKLKNGGVLVLP